MSIQTKEYHSAWRARNPCRIREYYTRYYARAKHRIALKRKSPEFKSKLKSYLQVWRINNRGKYLLAMKRWASQHADYLAEYRSSYGPRRRELYRQNRKAILARKKELAKDPEHKARVNKRNRERRKNDIQFCMKDRLRVTMGRALRRQFVKKSKRTMELVGCSPETLRSHMESLFKPGMSWENRHLWHVDHIIPLSSFDLRNKDEQIRAFNYKNLQPLWAFENHKKADLCFCQNRKDII